MGKPPAAKRRKTARHDASAATSSLVSRTISTTTSRRTTRSQKPRISAELLARVASYASLGADLLNLCIVAGPKDCAAIRHAYLHRCQDYRLHYLHGYVTGKVKCETCRDRSVPLGTVVVIIIQYPTRAIQIDILKTNKDSPLLLFLLYAKYSNARLFIYLALALVTFLILPAPARPFFFLYP